MQENNEKLVRAKTLIPKVGPKQAATLLGDTPLWRNFARRIQRHPYIKGILLKQQKGSCPVCLLGLTSNDVTHHVSYMNRCIYTDIHEIKNRVKSGRERTVRVPPCDSCERTNICTSYLSLVHSSCHVIIHDLEKDLQKDASSSSS